jgi:1-acyl-sn-glycerol-3-phosphate acyltransferase
MPLDRRRADFSAIRAAIDVLEQEGCMVIFPEGTRSRNGIPGKPKHGVSFLAHQTGAAVIPARVSNTDRFPALVPMRIRFGPPVHYEGGEGREAYRQFAERVMEAIFRL